jgi:outer membrane protein OmpA-like peptidoglycan-associated protein
MMDGRSFRYGFGNRFFSLVVIVVAISLVAGGCARKPRPVKPLDRPALDTPMTFEVAVRMIAFDLFAQISNQQMEVVNQQKPVDKKTPVVPPLTFTTDAVMNADTGEEIELSNKIHEIIKMTATNSFPQYSLIEMNSGNIDRSDYVIIGVIKQEVYNNESTKFPRLFLSAVDLKSSRIMAHSEVWIANQDMKLQPTPLYSDSPMFIKDARSEKVIATATAVSGGTVDQEYFATLATNALLAEASKAYDGGNYSLAVELFGKAAQRGDGQVMKTYAGLYQAHFKLRHMAEAEEAFGKLSELGINNGTLSVKFLFQVNDINFFGQPEEIAEYDIWIRQLAKKIIETQVCVEISGHASHSGKAEYNKKLSDRRAQKIRKRLQEVSPVIAKKTVAVGRGFEENIVGIGSDDIRDAIDRRVEFKVLDCGKM